jgi:type IV fimbrial biogenesis protein FimT
VLGVDEERLVLNQRRARGFTIIELMVAVTIIAILTALVIPTFGGMIQNSKIGSSSKSYLIGLQTARAEAIRRNTPVEFVLTNTPIAAGVENSAVPDAAGRNWVVRVTDPAASASYLPIETKSAQEGSGTSGTPSVQVVGAATAPPSATFAGVLAFNGLGSTTGGEAVVFDVSNPAGGPCAASGGPMRCQQIQVRPGGQIALCDPQAAAGDSRACPP